MLRGWIWRSPERFLSEREGAQKIVSPHFIEESRWKLYGAGITQLQSLGQKMPHTHSRRRCDKGFSFSRVNFQHRLFYGFCTATVYDRVDQCVCVRLKSYIGSHSIVGTADHWDRVDQCVCVRLKSYISFPSSFTCVLFSVRLLKGLYSKRALV